MPAYELYVNDTVTGQGINGVEVWVDRGGYNPKHGFTAPKDLIDGYFGCILSSGIYIVDLTKTGYYPSTYEIKIISNNVLETRNLTSTTPPPPEYSTVTISIVGQGSTEPPVGTHTYALGSTLYVTATPNSGWRYDRMRRNGVETQTNPGEFLNLGSTELIEVAFTEGVTPPPPTPRTSLLIPAIGIGLLAIGIIWMATKK